MRTRPPPRPGREVSQPPVIAIDGPAASGKGTVAAAVAARLGWRLLDSGALYRMVALMAVRRGMDLADGAAVARMAGALDIAFEGGVARVCGEDVSAAIRAPRIATPASRVAALPQVRAALLRAQRRLRQPPGLVADGRDMGTIVFQDATLKIFLTASAQARARRRLKQLSADSADEYERVLAALRQRDERDRTRAVAPLAPAADAVTVDSTDISANAVVARVLTLAGERGIHPAAP